MVSYLKAGAEPYVAPEVDLRGSPAIDSGIGSLFLGIFRAPPHVRSIDKHVYGEGVPVCRLTWTSRPSSSRPWLRRI